MGNSKKIAWMLVKQVVEIVCACPILNVVTIPKMENHKHYFISD
jgi:hypothetical protein